MLKRLSAAGLLWPSLITAVALPILISLGSWQMSRREWKEGLIAQISARTFAVPVALDEANRLWASGEDIEYLRVKVRGRFLHDKELYLYAPDARGPGYQVVTPLEVAGGAIMLVNRGFVPAHLKDPETRKPGQFAAEVEIVGLARAPAARTLFTPDNDVAGNQWYWRDFHAMFRAAFENTERPYTPYFLDAEAEPKPPGGFPAGGATRLALSNRHLEYALTWYGLAVTLLGVFGAYVWSRLKA